MLLSPRNARAHQQGWKALLVDMDSILDQSEVNQGNLENVMMEVAFKEDLTVSFGDNVTSCLEELFSGLVIEL